MEERATEPRDPEPELPHYSTLWLPGLIPKLSPLVSVCVFLKIKVTGRALLNKIQRARN